MNHYLLYKMIYGRILEATYSIMSTVFFIGAVVLIGNVEAWFFWAMGVLFAVLRWFVSRRMNQLEANFNLDE